MKIKNTKNKGITLIALIITIIIMLILAGVVLNLTIGENGLFKVAKNAARNYADASEDEQRALDELYKQLRIENLPENTEDTGAGTEVRPKDSWYSTTSAYVSTEDGSIVKKMTKVATVTAVATGNGEMVPVPNGFYYVGGKISTGVVISDDVRDQNKYAGIADVPAGAKYNEDGTVKTYTDAEYKNLSKEEKKDVLMGNQFVWIPITANEYVKKDWKKSSATWETTTNGTELPQIQKYGGFYIGRYEAGTSNISLSTGINFGNQNTSSSWRNDDFSIRDELNHTVTGKITLKAGEIPYYHADYFTALKLSNSMYQTDYVQSVLVTGTMWDAMMKFIAESDDTVVTSSTWGNYTDGNVTYIEGKGRYATVNSSNGAMTSAFTKCDGKYYYGIKTTAISEDVKKKNLYDVAGNLWEWTEEAAYPNDTNESYVLRGGAFDSICMIRPACYRGYKSMQSTFIDYGFRPALFIK